MASGNLRELTLKIGGMDCADCTRHVQQALQGVQGVEDVSVLLATEKARLTVDSNVAVSDLIRAVERSGYSVEDQSTLSTNRLRDQAVKLIWPFFLLAGIIVFIVVIGEWIGWFERISSLVPVWVYIVLILLGGFPVFKAVLQAAFQRRVISHTLMTVGVLAASIVQEWPSAVVIVLFMRVGNWVERQTTKGARDAITDFARRAPSMATVLRDGVEEDVKVDQINVGDVLICRSGMAVAADGEVIDGYATLDVSSITGESTPADVHTGSHVYAGSVVVSGGFQLRAGKVGRDTTLSRLIQLVEQAELDKGPVQRFADRFSGYYLPIVLGIALATWILRQDLIAAVSVLVVVCSCAIALATPVAMLASIGAAGSSGLVIKGGRFMERLPEVDVILLDKTGTLTFGAPEVRRVIPLSGFSEEDVLMLASGVERYSEHPFAKAIRNRAEQLDLNAPPTTAFQAMPGQGAEAMIGTRRVRLGNADFIHHNTDYILEGHLEEAHTHVYVESDGVLIGVIALADTLRPEIAPALEVLRELGYSEIKLVTGDKAEVAKPIAEYLGIPYHAGCLPEDKIRLVRDLQAEGNVVAMIGDGVNDAPAIAQADVGIAMGSTGFELSIQAADIALLRDDWTSIPALFYLAKRTMGVIRMNLYFTALYNLLGLGLAAFGFLPPALAAAAQSLPDVGILVNSSRLLKFTSSEALES